MLTPRYFTCIFLLLLLMTARCWSGTASGQVVELDYSQTASGYVISTWLKAQPVGCLITTTAGNALFYVTPFAGIASLTPFQEKLHSLLLSAYSMGEEIKITYEVDGVGLCTITALSFISPEAP